MLGGLGANVFRLGPGESGNDFTAEDRVEDSVRGKDRLDLSVLLAVRDPGFPGGAAAFSVWQTAVAVQNGVIVEIDHAGDGVRDMHFGTVLACGPFGLLAQSDLILQRGRWRGAMLRRIGIRIVANRSPFTAAIDRPFQRGRA